MTLSKAESIPFPQEPLWKETLNVLGRAENVGLLANAKALEGILDFNSQETRTRYGRAMATRFSRVEQEILGGFLDVAKAGTVTKTIEEIWRILFCAVEPLVAQTYLEIVWPREPGSIIDRNEIRSYVETTFQQQSKKLNTRLLGCLRQAGYVIPQGKDSLIVVGFANLDDSLVVSTHLLLAQAPRTIKLSDIEISNYWRFLGYRKFDHVRLAFRSAEARGLLMRYASVDHLEQITTRFSLSELLPRIKS